MKKRLWVWIAPALLVAAGVGAWFEPTYTVRGLVREERFFEDRPSSWWRHKLLSEEPVDRAEYPRRLRDGGAASIPVLADLLHAPEPEVRWQSAGILGKLGPAARPAAPALAALLTDADLHVRTIAAQSLGEIHPDDDAIVASLASRLKTGDRELVIRPLSGFGAAARDAIPDLIEILTSDSSSHMRWEAARTLGKIGPAAKSAVSALIQATMDHDPLLREHAAEALGDIGPDAAEAVPALVVALEDPETKVRRDAVRSLGQIGPAAKSALPEVEKLLEDREPMVRDAAKTAIRRIDPASSK